MLEEVKKAQKNILFLPDIFFCAFELFVVHRPNHSMLNFKLGVDADFFKEFANIHVEGIFIHDIAPVRR